MLCPLGGLMASITTDTPVDPFDRLAADVAATILTLPPSEVETAIVMTLRRIVEVLEADRATFATFRGDGTGDPALRTWARPGAARSGAAPAEVTVNIDGQI